MKNKAEKMEKTGYIVCMHRKAKISSTTYARAIDYLIPQNQPLYGWESPELAKIGLKYHLDRLGKSLEDIKKDYGVSIVKRTIVEEEICGL